MNACSRSVSFAFCLSHTNKQKKKKHGPEIIAEDALHLAAHILGSDERRSAFCLPEQ